jgi:hypothetical protein
MDVEESLPTEVPLTITMPAKADPGPVDSVRVSWSGASDPEIIRREDERTQFLVGSIPLGDDPVTFTVEFWHGPGANPPKDSPDITFAKEAVCSDGPGEGTIDRIACAVVQKGGDKLICTATYAGMATPPDTCTGTYACVKCSSGTRVCGSNPDCAN